MIEIRRAEPQDMKYLIILTEQLGYKITLDQFKTRFDIFNNQKNYGIAIAEQSNNILGFVAWSISSLFVLPKSRIHIEAIMVDQEYRAQGVGKMLMSYIEDLAKSYSPCVVDLVSGVRRSKEGTHEFYRKLGYNNEGSMAKLYLRKEI